MALPSFDGKRYAKINIDRRDFLAKFLPALLEDHALQTALDVGCGFGYFSGYLAELGLRVTAFDARPENVAEASRRNPNVTFHTYDAEDRAVLSLGTYDLLLCSGLLYHLENPFLAVRNLASLTDKILIIETVVAPSKSQVAVLITEARGPGMSLTGLALVPSESWLLMCLYRSGFPLVYQTRLLPDHVDFRRTPFRARLRTVLLASKVELKSPILRLAPEPKLTNRYPW